MFFELPSSITKSMILRHKNTYTVKLGYSRKNPNRGRGRSRKYLSEKTPWNFLISHFTVRNSGENKLSPLETCVTHENSTWVFLEHSW